MISSGQLTVLVDSSPHLYELKQLLLAGLQKQLLVACKAAGLRKIHLKLGRWYDTTGNGPAALWSRSSGEHGLQLPRKLAGSRLPSRGLTSHGPLQGSEIDINASTKCAYIAITSAEWPPKSQ